MKRVLITGIAGFIGSHFVDEILSGTDWTIMGMARLGTIGDLERLKSSRYYLADRDRVEMVYHDLKFSVPSHVISRVGKVDAVIHLAANSHVDRSITHPWEFFMDNVMGTVNLLEWLRQTQPDTPIINFSTDEVFGPAPPGYSYKEEDRWRPSNPYSASKAGQSAVGISYHTTYGMPIITTYTMNVFGEKQNPEKLVAKAIRSILQDKPIPIHSKIENGEVVYVGQRHWIHARNVAKAALFILERGKPGEHYNIVGEIELHNDEIVKMIGKIIGKQPVLEYIDYHRGRPGHDRRYALDGSKLREMGWTIPMPFIGGLEKTVTWYMNNPRWL